MIFIICIFLVFSSVNSFADKIHLAGDPWPPYHSIDPSKKQIASNILLAVYKKAGIDAVVDFYPWARSQSKVKKGDLDGLALVWYTKERDKYVLYTKPFLITEIVIVKRKQDPVKYEDKKDLYGRRIGTLTGYGYYDLIDATKSRISKVRTLKQNLLKLYYKRIDLTIGGRLELEHVLSQLPKEVSLKLKIVKKPIGLKPLHTAISRRHPKAHEMVKRFNKALLDMIKSGEYQKLINKSSPKPRSIM